MTFIVFTLFFFFFFFNDTATTEIYTLSLHDALPISRGAPERGRGPEGRHRPRLPQGCSRARHGRADLRPRPGERAPDPGRPRTPRPKPDRPRDRPPDEHRPRGGQDRRARRRPARRDRHARRAATPRRPLRAPGERLRGRAGVRVFLRLLGFLKPHVPHVALAIVLGVATVASNVGLLATAAYVISAAVLVPLLGYLAIPVYLVRLFGVSRAGARYAERMVSHSLTFKLLADLRTWFYSRLEPLAPARLLRYRSGDLLSRIVKDVEELENAYLRIVSPLAVTAFISFRACLVFYVFDPALALLALGSLVATGVGVPLLVGRLARGLGRRQLDLRAEIGRASCRERV